MNSWFRYYHAALDHPKVGKLTDAQFRTWVGVLCVACRGDGALPPIVDLAFSLRLLPKDAAKRVDVLVAAGLVDRDGEKLRPHNWDIRQFKSDGSTERVKRFRTKQGNVAATADEAGRGSEDQTARNVSVTADETVRDAENDRVRNVPATVCETGPDSDSDSDSESSSSARAQTPDDDELRAKLREAARGRIRKTCVNVKPIRKLMAHGCDLERDIQPFIAETFPHLSGPLGTWGGNWPGPDILAFSRERRAAEARGESPGQTARRKRIFVDVRSPEWGRACEVDRRVKGVRSGPDPCMHGPDGKSVGWYFLAATLALDDVLAAKLGLREAAE